MSISASASPPSEDEVLADDVGESFVHPEEFDDDGLVVDPLVAHEWGAAHHAQTPSPQLDSTGWATLLGKEKIGRVTYITRPNGSSSMMV